MANLQQTRKRVNLAIAVLLFIAAAAAAYLLTPWADQAARYEELVRLEGELQKRTQEVAPLRNIDQKLVTARQQIQGFYSRRFPQQASEISAELGSLASEHGVDLLDVRYTFDATDLPDLQRVGIDANLSGSYEDVAEFINSLERSPTLFIISGLGLQEQQGGQIRLSLRVETYRNTAGAPAA